MTKKNIKQSRIALLKDAISKYDIKAIDEILGDLGTNIKDVVNNVKLPNELMVEYNLRTKLNDIFLENLASSEEIPTEKKPSNNPRGNLEANPMKWSFDRERK